MTGPYFLRAPTQSLAQLVLPPFHLRIPPSFPNHRRFAHYGLSSNLVSYLTGELGQPTAATASMLNAWFGTSSLLPILGAFVADSFASRFRMIIVSCLLYVEVIWKSLIRGMVAGRQKLKSFKGIFKHTRCLIKCPKEIPKAK